MSDNQILNYTIKDPLELNLSYMPFLINGGLFIPTPKSYAMGDRVVIELSLPGRKESLRIEGKVVWITPKNALHHVLPGIGVQFTGANAASVRTQIESQLDRGSEVGGVFVWHHRPLLQITSRLVFSCHSSLKMTRQCSFTYRVNCACLVIFA